jgi:hypothetical protein
MAAIMVKTEERMRHQDIPFRIGTTSYIYPDDILPNVHRLKGKIDDIELVLFEANNAGNIPLAEVVSLAAFLLLR